MNKQGVLLNKQEALKILQNERLSTEEIAELSWLLNAHLYKERPVTISEFIESDDFVHKKWPNVFPLWKKTLRELFPTPFNAPYNEVLISAAAGAGKTVTATISIVYDIYKLGCLKDPCTFYGLTPDTMIIMAIFSATGSTAAVNWNDITSGIENCPWINDKVVDRRGLEKKYGSIVPVEILPGIFIQTGSKFQHSMGKAIFDGLMDEAAFGGANMKDAQKSYNELSSRMKTRFGNFSDSGTLPGQLFLISSPKEAGDFMQYRIEKAQEADSKLTKIIQNVAIWDADPRKDSEEKFTVFIGNENKEPCIYEEDADIPLEEMDDLLYVPTKFLDDFKKDLLISIMNYGGITTTSDMALFKSPTLLNDIFVLNNPFNMDVIKLPFSKTDKQLMDFCDLNYFRDIRHPECNRFIHIDAAYSTNTLDVYGLAASYCVLTDQTTFRNDNFSGEIEPTDVYTKKDRMFFTDFVIGITAPKGEEVNLTKVQDFVEYLIKNCGYPVACITADQFQSKQTLQNFETKGYTTDYISVDKTRDPYLFLRHLVHNKQILIPKNAYSLDELKKLRDDGKKVDHPVGCFTGDTKIQLVDGRNVSINDLLLEQQYKTNWVYTFNEQTNKIEPKRIKNIWQTKITKDLVKVTLDNGEVIKCTPDHRFMLRDGSYEEIQNLTPGTSLMPLYTKISNKGLNGYRLYYEPMENKWHYEHRQFGNPTKERNIIHHCNYNKLDNTPTNLLAVTNTEHTTIHNNRTRDYKQISESVKKWHERIKGTEEQKQIREKISKKVISSLTPEQKQKRQNKLDFIKGLEQYYGVVYEKLTQKERQSYGSKYIAIAYPEVIEHHSEALKQAHKDGKYAHRKGTSLNRYWVTNGIINKYMPTGEEIPQGFYKGRTFSKETLDNMKKANSHANWTPEQKQAYSDLQRELTGNRIWVTNGVEDKYITKDSTIPDGFKPGRCKVGKNHKIVSIEFITEPSRVYDLEIDSNHNFALSAGVIVHNSHKDTADAIAGSIWKCANSTEIINRGKVMAEIMEPGSVSTGIIYTPEQLKTMEMQEFERLKSQFKTGMFKGL